MKILDKLPLDVYRKERDSSELRAVIGLKAEERKAFNDGTETVDKYAEGYAATFTPTILFEIDGVQYIEVVDRNAFVDADMSDVIFNYNHGGKVLSRTRNKTLTYEIDSNGLFIKANLGGTEEGRRMHEEIKGGYVDRMSFRFSVAEDSYNRDTHTRTILKVKKVYDVSAVDIPAYETTTISARSYFEAVAEKEKADELAEKRRKLKLKLKLGGL